MLKRILLTLMALLVVYSAVLVGYKMFEPETGEVMDKTVTDSAIDYDALKDYTLNSGASAIHYYFFESPSDNDSVYVVNTVLHSTANETALDLGTVIEFVDVTSLVDSNATDRLKADWGISHFPAFVACQAQNGSIRILNSLEWNASAPMSKDDVIQWLILNGLYDGATPDLIATPAA